MRLDGLRANLRTTACGVGLTMTLAMAWLGIAGSAQESTDTVPVCVGADRVLRFVEVERNCKAGEQRFVLASATVESESEEPETKKPSPKKPDQSSGQGSSNSDGHATKVTAPFEVVDAQGKTIMRVSEDDGTTYGRGIYIFNDQQRAVTTVGVSTSGSGRLVVRNKAGDRNRYLQMIYGDEGPTFAITGNSGKSLLVINQQGSVWYNANEVPAISLGAGESGTKGVLKIADENGTSVVEAGSLTGGRGIVRVFPSRGQTPLNIPQFLMGSKP